MKLTDIEQIHEAGLITSDQSRKIIEHFNLEHPRNRFLTILVTLGGLLVLVGLILVISANWDNIPGLAKIGAGAALMCGAHLAGWILRRTDEKETPSKLSEVFHFIGAGLFLANIGLVGQVYHLSSRTPNALLLWIIGIIPLAWILRSLSIHALSLVGVLFWLGFEINAQDGWFYSPTHVGQFAVYASVGAFLYGCGLLLDRTRFASFGAVTQKFGILALHLGLWPMLFISPEPAGNSLLLLALLPGLAGLALIASETRRLPTLTAQWRLTWLGVLAVWLGLGALSMTWNFAAPNHSFTYDMTAPEAFAAILIVAGCFMQIRVAEELRAPWMVNVAIVTIAFASLATFLRLVSSMMDTGLLFLVGGAGILALGFWLEKKRRSILQRMEA